MLRNEDGAAIALLPDGRDMAYRECGDPAGTPVIALHGTPGSRLKFDMAAREAAGLGVRLISPDRWGYGLSDAPRDPQLANYGRDVGQLADILDLERFAVLGVSGGGPFAVSVAGHTDVSGRVSRMALVAPVGPIDVTTRMSLFHKFCFLALPRIPGGVRCCFALFRSGLKHRPELTMRALALRAGPADRGLLADASVRDNLVEAFRAGLEPGIEGPVLDMRLFRGVNDLALRQVACPVRIWSGSSDRNVPLEPIRKLANRLGRCEKCHVPGAGHYWVTKEHGAVLRWLAA